MSVDGAERCAIALYALPLVVWFVVRARRDTSLLSFALDVPAIFAADLFGVILLATAMPLDDAILVSRPLWLALIVGFAVWRRWRFGEKPAWPVAVDAKVIAATVASGAIAGYISTHLTHNYIYWDRYWHDPQITAIASQRVPFVNVYEPSALLRYHYAADVHGALIRALSFHVLSSNRALAVSHAVAFILPAAATTLFAIALARRHHVFAIVLGLGTVLFGPIPLQNELAPLLAGFMYTSNVINSGRPNVASAVVLVVGIVLVAAGRLFQPRESTPVTTLARLLPIFLLMSLMDESSGATCGLALFVAWLIDGRVLADSRLAGFGILAACGIASVLPTRMLGGSMSPGGPVEKLEWIDAKVPPAQAGTSIPFADPRATHILLVDLLPMLLCCAAIVAVLLARPSRSRLALLALPVTVIASCTYVAIHLRVNGHAEVETQRFFFAPSIVAIVAAIAAISSMRAGSISLLLAFAGIGVPAIFSLFLVTRLPMVLTKEAIATSPLTAKLNDVDCRTSANAGFFDDRPMPTYVETPVFYMYTACRGVFSPGGTDPPWTTKIYPHYGAEQLDELYATMVPNNRDIVAVCSANAPTHDRVCARVLTHRSTCWAVGTDYVKCPLTSDDRASLH